MGNLLGNVAMIVSASAIVASLTFGMMNANSSPQVLFTLFAYFQLLSTILLLRYHIPECLEEMILNFGVFKLDFKFLISWIPISSFFLKSWFDEAIDQNNERLSDIGYESGSMAENYVFFFLSMAILGLFHLLHNFLYP